MSSFPDPGARRRAVEEVGSFASALGVREIVRDPNEPTLAEIREKVRGLQGFLTFSRSSVGERVVCESDVLALLEPRKPAKPRPPTTVQEVRALVQSLHDEAKNVEQKCAYGVVLANLGDA